MEHTRILVVEDEAIVARDIRNRLRTMGYEVTAVAHTGQDAIRYAEESIPNLVLMDINLIGGMDGIEAAGLIQDRWDIPVVYLTAYSDQATLDRAKITTPMGYLIKPFEDRDLNVTVDMALYRHWTARELKMNEAKLRTIFEQANDEIIYLDTDGTVIEVNQRIEAIFGYQREEVIGRNFLEIPFASPEMISELASEMEDVLGTKGTKLKMLEGKRKDGTTVFVEVNTSLVHDEETVSGIIATIRDVSERMRAEENLAELNVKLEEEIAERRGIEYTLRESEEKYAAIVEHSHDSVLIVQDQRLTFVNQAHIDLTGYTAEELLAMPLLNLVTSPFKEKAAESIRGWVDGDHVFPKTETQIRCKDQMVRDMEVYTTRICLKGKPAYLITMHDVTERNRAEHEAARAAALEELNQLKDALVASVSHELRTPLTTIKGYANSLLQPDVQWDPDMQMQFIQAIDAGADKLTYIVQDLIDVSQIEAGTIRLEKESTDIPTIIGNIEDQLAISAVDHQLEMTVTSDLPLVHCDKLRIGQVITNLVANAAAYSDKGTRIILKANQVDEKVVVSIADEGIGIAQSEIERVFDRFHRLESAMTRRKGGTGLGLAISRGIIEGHGEHIWVDSREGEGSMFSFTLPEAEDAEYLKAIEVCMDDDKQDRESYRKLAEQNTWKTPQCYSKGYQNE